jgi:hypothetical protein
MSDLAFNMNGEPFEVPTSATGWRVRRMKPKGAPEVVYGRDGLPVVLPLDASVDDLRDAVEAPGRYRVDPVADHHAIPNAPAGYVFVHDGAAPVAELRPQLPSPADDAVIEAMRMNAEIAKAVVGQFPQMMAAAAALLQAADGAGLPRRLPLAPQVSTADDTDDGGDPEPHDSGIDIEAIIHQLVPVVVAALQRGGKLDVASLVDWRRARKPDLDAPAPAAYSSLAIEPSAMAHLLAVQAALTADEVSLVRAVAKELGPEELRGWVEELRKLSVPDAVKRVRELISNHSKGGAA